MHDIAPFYSSDIVDTYTWHSPSLYANKDGMCIGCIWEKGARGKIARANRGGRPHRPPWIRHWWWWWWWWWCRIYAMLIVDTGQQLQQRGLQFVVIVVSRWLTADRYCISRPMSGTLNNVVASFFPFLIWSYQSTFETKTERVASVSSSRNNNGWRAELTRRGKME